MKVAIGGARALAPKSAPRLLAAFLLNLPEDGVVMLRRGKMTDPGLFEIEVSDLCRFLSIPVEWRVPEITDRVFGRASVYVRDFDMVAEADLTLVFISAERDPGEYSGTEHLLDKAIELDKPVYAYVVDNDGTVTRYGENDPEDQFADLVPSP